MQVGTCSVLHPLLPNSCIFWSVCWRVSGTLPLWTVPQLCLISGTLLRDLRGSICPCQTSLCLQRLRIALMVHMQTALHPHCSLRATAAPAEEWPTVHLLVKDTAAPTSCSLNFSYSLWGIEFSDLRPHLLRSYCKLLYRHSPPSLSKGCPYGLGSLKDNILLLSLKPPSPLPPIPMIKVKQRQFVKVSYNSPTRNIPDSHSFSTTTAQPCPDINVWVTKLTNLPLPVSKKRSFWNTYQGTLLYTKERHAKSLTHSLWPSCALLCRSARYCGWRAPGGRLLQPVEKLPARKPLLVFVKLLGSCLRTVDLCQNQMICPAEITPPAGNIPGVSWFAKCKKEWETEHEYGQVLPSHSLSFTFRSTQTSLLFPTTHRHAHMLAYTHSFFVSSMGVVALYLP